MILLTYLPEYQRHQMGASIIEAKKIIDTLRDMLFVLDEDGDCCEEKVHMAQDIFTVVNSWMKGEDPEYIAESVFQSDARVIYEILEAFGIDLTIGDID